MRAAFFPALLTRTSFFPAVVSLLNLLLAANIAVAATPVAYSRFIGGSDFDTINSVKIDRNGYIYLAGYTYSADFPVTPGAFMTTSNAGQMCGRAQCAVGFVMKLSPGATQLVYSTYFHDPVMSMTIDASGNAYLLGVIGEESNYTTTAGAVNHSGAHLFVAKLNAAGTDLAYAARIGSSGNDFPTAIAADTLGNAYFVGWSYATDYPVTVGAFRTTRPGAFVTKINPTGSALVYSARLGGSDTLPTGGLGTRPWAISVSTTGEAYVAGLTDSPTHPVTSNAYKTKRAGGADAFLTRMNSSGSALRYSTYLGGNSGGSGAGCCAFEGAYALAIDGKGGAYITGPILNSVSFPVTGNAFQKAFIPNSESTTFVARFNTNGSGAASLVYSTLLGGKSVSQFADRGIAVDASGNAYVTGPTSDLVFPTTPTGVQSCRRGAGGTDLFISVLGPAGNQLVFSTLFGGGSGDSPSALALDSSNNVYVAGGTDSADFPATRASFHPASGQADAFLAKFNRAAFTSFAARLITCHPANGASVLNPFQVVGALQSGYRGRSVAIFLDGVNVYQHSSWNTVNRFINASRGTHQVTVKAQNASGTTFSKSVSVTVK